VPRFVNLHVQQLPLVRPAARMHPAVETQLLGEEIMAPSEPPAAEVELASRGLRLLHAVVWMGTRCARLLRNLRSHDAPAGTRQRPQIAHAPDNYVRCWAHRPAAPQLAGAAGASRSFVDLFGSQSQQKKRIHSRRK